MTSRRPDEQAILLPAEVRDRLLSVIRSRHPDKCFGYLLSEDDPRRPIDFLVFERNVRNAPGWRPRFESYGRYFVEHADAGFVADPDETLHYQKQIWARGLIEVAIFHSHQRHPANFSQIDYDMHLSRFDSLWHLIVSMRNPRLPQLRAFDVTRSGVRELPLRVASLQEALAGAPA